MRKNDPLLPVVRAPIGPLFWNVHYTPIGRSARILSSVSLNSLVHSLSEFGLSLTIAAHQRLHRKAHSRLVEPFVGLPSRIHPCLAKALRAPHQEIATSPTRIQLSRIQR